MRNDCRRFRCLTVWSLVLFGKVMEFIGCWALLENLCHWKWALRVCSLAVHILFPCLAESIFSQFPALAVCCSACSIVTVYSYWRSVSDVEGDQETNDHSEINQGHGADENGFTVCTSVLWKSCCGALNLAKPWPDEILQLEFGLSLWSNPRLQLLFPPSNFFKQAPGFPEWSRFVGFKMASQLQSADVFSWNSCCVCMKGDSQVPLFTTVEVFWSQISNCPSKMKITFLLMVYLHVYFIVLISLRVLSWFLFLLLW